MRIVVNDIAASTGGAMTILEDFYSYIKENDTGIDWVLLLGDNYFNESENIKILTFPKVKKSWINKVLFDFITGKKIIRKLKPDVVFSLQNIITFGMKTPQVVYIHQSLPFQTVKRFSLFKKSERMFAIYQYIIGFIIKQSAKKASKVIVQTKWMKDSICNITGVKKEKVLQVASDIERLSSYKIKDKFNNKSFFYPTSNAIYKNNECIYKACELLNEGVTTNYKVSMTISGSSNINNIEFMGRISREKVMEKYNESTLVFPSYIESFGLPLLEAREMGTIILASDCEFSREILEGYGNAYFFDPFKPQELALLMKKVLTEHIVRGDIYRPRDNPENSWQNIVSLLSVLEKEGVNA
jgi:glycosyltransferase involved in cell wall biosynthesis